MGRKPRESTAVTKEFADRISELIQEKKETGLSHEEICTQAGVASGAMSEWASDTKTANIDSLYKIAKYFGVSTDYLLGLTDIRSPDVNIQKLAKETGLSEECIEALKTIHETDVVADKTGRVKYEFSETINFLVESEPDFSPIVWIGRYLSVPEIKADHYISVDGKVRKKSNCRSIDRDGFVDISQDVIEDAFLQRVASELMSIKLKLNADRNH